MSGCGLDSCSTYVPVVDACRGVGVDPHWPRMVEQLRVRGRIRRGGGLGPCHTDAFDASVAKARKYRPGKYESTGGKNRRSERSETGTIIFVYVSPVTLLLWYGWV